MSRAQRQVITEDKSKKTHFLILGNDLISTWNITVDLLVQNKKEEKIILLGSFGQNLTECLAQENLDIEFLAFPRDIKVNSMLEKYLSSMKNEPSIFIFDLFSCGNFGGSEMSPIVERVLLHARFLKVQFFFLLPDPFIIQPNIRFQMDQVFTLRRTPEIHQLWFQDLTFENFQKIPLSVSLVWSYQGKGIEFFTVRPLQRRRLFYQEGIKTILWAFHFPKLSKHFLEALKEKE